eukprot:gene17309-biopygen9851
MVGCLEPGICGGTRVSKHPNTLGQARVPSRNWSPPAPITDRPPPAAVPSVPCGAGRAGRAVPCRPYRAAPCRAGPSLDERAERARRVLYPHPTNPAASRGASRARPVARPVARRPTGRPG